MFHSLKKVPALFFSPVSLWNGGDGGLEAIGVVAPVTAVTQQQCVLILPAMTELNTQRETSIAVRA